VYPNAIAVGGPAGVSEIAFMGILMITFLIIIIIFSIMILGFAAFDIFSAFIVLAIISGFYCLSFFIRMTFFSFRDLPTLFNRKLRTVSLSKPRHLSFLKFWQPAVVDRVITYSWDTVQARTYKILQMMGETAREPYSLTLLCADTDNPRLFKDFTYLGHVETWEDATLWRLWEHIRRYMEEDGPPLQPDETLRTSGIGKLPQFPQHLIDAAGGEALSIQEIEQLTGFDHRLW
ncbi:DUF6708 domain-containing protein, partial [Pseudomonas agarici]